jgi:transcriptional regulator with XRE-family HTH domain
MAAVQTRRKRKLGLFLNALRKRAGKTELDFRELTRKSQSSLSKIENGFVLPSWTELGALLGLYGATDAERLEAQGLWEDAKQDSTRLVHPSAYTPEARTYARQEADAAVMRTIESSGVPGLLQTPQYATAVRLAAHRFSNSTVALDQIVAARMSRQKLLDGSEPLRLHAIIDEAVLHRTVGGPEVMRAQLLHLHERSKQANITIQVIPFGVGAYGSMSGGGSIILGFDDDSGMDAVYLEYNGGGKWVDNVDDVRKFQAHFDDIANEVALSPKESAALVRRLANALKGT